MTDRQPSTLRAASYRLANERVSLQGLVERLAPLISRGTKPVLTIGAVSPEEVDSALAELLRALDLAWAVVDGAGRVNAGHGSLCLAREHASIVAGAEVQRAIADGDRSAMVAMGLMVGFPECCVHAHVASAFSAMPLPDWAVLARRAEADAPVPVAMQPLLVPTLAFVPCSMHCPQALSLYEQWFRDLGIEPSQFGGHHVVQVLSLRAPPHDDAATLHWIEERDDALTYDPSQWTTAKGPLQARLSAGTRLTLTPAGLQVLSDERLVALLGPHHALWSTERCWHAEQWRERAVTEAQRTTDHSAIDVPSG